MSSFILRPHYDVHFRENHPLSVCYVQWVYGSSTRAIHRAKALLIESHNRGRFTIRRWLPVRLYLTVWILGSCRKCRMLIPELNGTLSRGCPRA